MFHLLKLQKRVDEKMEWKYTENKEELEREAALMTIAYEEKKSCLFSEFHLGEKKSCKINKNRG